MKRHLPHCLAAGALFLVMGCGQNTAPAPEPSSPKINASSPQETKTEVVLGDLLKKPRTELASLGEEWASRVQDQEKTHREAIARSAVLVNTRLPLVLPVWREAKFSPQAGLSFPPYWKEATKDNACALHLARFGDIEAARKVTESGDKETLRKIDALALGRNYPVEWTRLAALVLQSAQYRLASGEESAIAELAELHRQLQEVLDPKAASGPLGADLLARGRQVLTLASKAWREAKQTDLADQAEAALAAWGKVPPPAIAIPFGEARGEAAPVLGNPGQGRLVSASVLRALDLLALPLPIDGVQGVFAFFNQADRLTDVLVTYRPRVSEVYPTPVQLAQAMENYALLTVDSPAKADLRSRTYQGLGLDCIVTFVPHSNFLGACARFSDPRQSVTPPNLGRDLGTVHLDRSFEMNRALLAPEQSGDTLLITQARLLKLIGDPLRPPDDKKSSALLTLSGATLQREARQDLLGQVTLRYTLAKEKVPLGDFVQPLWQAHGPGKLTVSEAAQGVHPALAWENDKTRYLLILPTSDQQPIELTVVDAQGPNHLAARRTAAQALDQTERQARLKAGKPLIRLPRQIDIEWAPVPSSIELGMTREKAQQAIPSIAGVFKQEVAGGLRVLFTSAPGKNATSVLRELFLRWSPMGRVGEIRARYEEGPGVQSLLNAIRKRGGASQDQPGSWTALWTDLPARKPEPILHRWQDDLTRLMVQRDAGGAEVIWLDCPPDQPTGLSFPPLEYLPRGVDDLKLGDMREEVLRRWNASSASKQADGSFLLTPSKAGAFDAFLVWFDKDRVARIVARHTGEAGKPADQARALAQAWGKEAKQLGYPRRQEAAGENLLQGLSWHDDRTRVRIFWQPSNDGTARLFTEWKTWTP